MVGNIADENSIYADFNEIYWLCLNFIYGVRKNSRPKLCEVMGGIKTKIYYQETICRTYVLAALRTVELGLIKVRNQGKPLNYSEKKAVIRTKLEQIF